MEEPEPQEPEAFVPRDKELNEVPLPAAQAPQIPAEEVINMAGKKLNLDQEKIREFTDWLEENDVEFESDLRAASDGKLRSWGLSDKMILSVKKTLNELVTIRKIVHGADAVASLSQYPEEELTTSAAEYEVDEGEWHCLGQGR